MSTNYKVTSTTPSLPPLLSSSSLSSSSSKSSSAFVFNTLPIDCTSHILSFLRLVDCLTFGSTSTLGLGAIQDDLKNRRRKILLRGRQTTHGSSGTTTMTSSSLLHRADVLHSIIPDSHPLRDDISYLLSLLLSASTDDEEEEEEVEETEGSSWPKTISTTSTTSTTTYLIQKMHSTLLINRLHATILHRCMTPTDLLPPPPSSSSHQYTHHQRHHHHSRLGKTLTATLSRYIGDVLCIAYLLPSDSSSIIDGSPTLCRYMRTLTLELTRRRILSAATWYQIWIFLHAVLLRLLPLSCRRQLFNDGGRCRPRRNVANDGEEEEEEDGMSCLPTIPSFLLWRLKVILKTLRDDTYESCSPRFTFRDFGTLGPTFRGRDRVNSFDLLTSTVCIMMLEIIKRVEWPMVMQQTGQVDGDNEGIEDEEEEQNVVLMRSLGWMVKVHSEAERRRPMTVEGPVVTFATRL